MPEKINPQVRTELQLRKSESLTTEIDQLLREAEDANNRRQKWLKKQRRNMLRRWGLHNKKPDYPWPGASDINLPIDDMLVESIKNALMSAVEQKPRVIAVPMIPAAVDRAINVEMYLNARLDHYMSDFERQAHIWADGMCQAGIGIAKVFYDFQTRDTQDLIFDDDIPARIPRIEIVDATEDQADAVFQEAADSGLTPGLLMITPGEFKEQRDQILQRIAAEYQLDLGIPMEKQSAEDILQVLLGKETKAIVRKLDVVYDAPRMQAIPIEDIIVPPNCKSIEQSPWIVHIVRYSIPDFRRVARDRAYDKDVVKEMIESAKVQSNDGAPVTMRNLRRDKDQRDGLFSSTDENTIVIWEMYAHSSVVANDSVQRVVHIFDAGTKKRLRSTRYPYKHGEWPFIGAPFELNEDKYYSHRGIPEKIRDLSVMLTSMHRAKINRLTMETALTMKVKENSKFNMENWKFIPGQGIPVKKMDDLEILQIPNLSSVFSEEEAVVRGWAENYIGTIDFGLNSPSNINDARSATEITALLGAQEKAVSGRSRLFVMALKKVYQQWWDLEQQYAPAAIQWITTGADGKAQIFHATREDIQGDFDIRPNVPVGAFDKASQLGLDMARIQLMMQAKPLVEEETGVELMVGQAILRFLERSDPVAARATIRQRSDEEIQQLNQQKAQAQQTAQRAANAEIAVKEADAQSKQGGNQQTALDGEAGRIGREFGAALPIPGGVIDAADAATLLGG